MSPDQAHLPPPVEQPAAPPATPAQPPSTAPFSAQDIHMADSSDAYAPDQIKQEPPQHLAPPSSSTFQISPASPSTPGPNAPTFVTPAGQPDSVGAAVTTANGTSAQAVPSYHNVAPQQSLQRASTPSSSSAAAVAAGRSTGAVAGGALPPSAPMGSANSATGSAVRVYLNTKVVPSLLEGMKGLGEIQPEKPLEWLADFLRKKSGEIEGGVGMTKVEA